MRDYCRVLQYEFGIWPIRRAAGENTMDVLSWTQDKADLSSCQIILDVQLVFISQLSWSQSHLVYRMKKEEFSFTFFKV